MNAQVERFPQFDRYPNVKIKPFAPRDDETPAWIAMAQHACADITSQPVVLYRENMRQKHAFAFRISDNELLGWIAALKVIDDDRAAFPAMAAFIGENPDHGLHETMTNGEAHRAKGLEVARRAESEAMQDYDDYADQVETEVPDADGAGAPEAAPAGNVRKGGDFSAANWFRSAKAIAALRDAVPEAKRNDMLAAYAKRNGLKPAHIRQVVGAHDKIEELRPRHPELAKKLETQGYRLTIDVMAWRPEYEQEAVAGALRVIAGEIKGTDYQAMPTAEQRKRRPKGSAAAAPAEAPPAKAGAAPMPRQVEMDIDAADGADGGAPPPDAPAETERTEAGPQARAKPAATPKAEEAPASERTDYDLTALDAIARIAFGPSSSWSPDSDEHGRSLIASDRIDVPKVATIVIPRGLTPKEAADARWSAAAQAALNQGVGMRTYVAVPGDADPQAVKGLMASHGVNLGFVVAMTSRIVEVHSGELL